jgi:lipopolysaccharide/colanic/teichoic acid biosynthesis glycosyltransferase
VKPVHSQQLDGGSATRRYDAYKRGVDVACAGLGLLLATPLIGLLMLAIRLDSPGPSMFRQTRIGRGGCPFTIYKLRTFHGHCHGFYGDEEIRWCDPRITRIGAWLRRSKLDELPQLYNVLCGDMSLVGPRPSLPEQVEPYSLTDLVRLDVRPGLTGVAQISGNTFVPWPDRIQLDRWYVAHRSLRVDLAVLVHTIPVICRGERSDDDPLELRNPTAGLAIEAKDAIADLNRNATRPKV